METLRLLEKLTQHHGVAGDEKPIADLWKRRFLIWVRSDAPHWAA